MSIRKGPPVTRFPVYLSSGKVPFQLNVLFKSGDVHSVLERRDYQVVNMMDLFFETVVAKATEYREW